MKKPRKQSPAQREAAKANLIPGRKPGTRVRLSANFISAFSTDFDEHGESVITKVRESNPVAYLTIAASLVPKQVEVDKAGAFTALGDDALDVVIADTARQLEDVAGRLH